MQDLIPSFGRWLVALDLFPQVNHLQKDWCCRFSFSSWGLFAGPFSLLEGFCWIHEDSLVMCLISHLTDECVIVAQRNLMKSPIQVRSVRWSRKRNLSSKSASRLFCSSGFRSFPSPTPKCLFALVNLAQSFVCVISNCVRDGGQDAGGCDWVMREILCCVVRASVVCKGRAGNYQ